MRCRSLVLSLALSLLSGAICPAEARAGSAFVQIRQAAVMSEVGGMLSAGGVVFSLGTLVPGLVNRAPGIGLSLSAGAPLLMEAGGVSLLAASAGIRRGVLRADGRSPVMTRWWGVGWVAGVAGTGLWWSGMVTGVMDRAEGPVLEIAAVPLLALSGVAFHLDGQAQAAELKRQPVSGREEMRPAGGRPALSLSPVVAFGPGGLQAGVSGRF